MTVATWGTWANHSFSSNRVGPSGQTAPQGSPTTTGKLTQVTTALLVQVDGADTACPCFWVGPAQTVSVGQRVQVTVRRPRAPLVQVLS